MNRLVSDTVVCREFGITGETLEKWVREGLIRRDRDGEIAGFAPDQVRRIWSIVSLGRDLDVNLEGIQIILELSDQISDLQLVVRKAAQEIRRLRRLDRFHLRIIEERYGPVEWEVEL